MATLWKRLGDLASYERILKGERLSEIERHAISSAYELERAQVYWPITAVLNLLFFFGAAGALWGLVFGLWLGGLVIGAMIGLGLALTICRYPIFHEIKVISELKERQIFHGVWIKLAIVLTVLGGIGEVIRLFMVK